MTDERYSTDEGYEERILDAENAAAEGAVLDAELAAELDDLDAFVKPKRSAEWWALTINVHLGIEEAHARLAARTEELA